MTNWIEGQNMSGSRSDLSYEGSLSHFDRQSLAHGHRLRLRAEMKVPGRAWLEFEARTEPQNKTLLLQTAFFEPKGLLGLLYWYALYPIHSLIFSGLISCIVEKAARQSGGIEQAKSNA
jgi:hypothetical protein